MLILIVSYYEQKITLITLAHRRDQRPNEQPERASVKESDDLVVIYNRVPKTGSTSFVGIAYDLCGRNGFNVVHLNTSKNSHVMSLADQVRLTWNITQWTERHPLLLHGHIAFLDFGKLGLTTAQPVLINLIRRPLDRLISYYYFLRNGDNFRPNLVRKKQGDKRSFDDCVAENGRDCRVENLWLQIPFFCGQHSDCWKPGNKWALEEAKRNLVDHYLLVGVTEEMREFVQILEYSLPRMFRGATLLYEKGNKSHLRKTFHKLPPNSETIAKIQQSRVWQMENEFYQFVVDNFHFIRDKTLLKPADQLTYRDRGQQFFYEKIRPKS